VVGATAFLAMLFFASRVEASTIAVLRSSSAPDCPDAAVLARSIRTMTPKAPAPAATNDDGPDRVTVSFDRGREGYRVRIETRGENAGSRELTDPNTACSSLAQATALTIALILDPNATPPPPPPVPNEEKSGEERGAHWAISAFVGGGAALGVVRSAAPFAMIGLTATRSPFFALSVSGVLVPGQSLSLPPGTVDVSLTGGAATLCVVPLGSEVRIGACAGTLVAALSAAGRGYASDSTARRPLIGATLGVVVEGSLVGPVRWGAHVDGFAPIHRESFGISGAGVAYDEPTIGGFASVGASVRFR
jgi:hypothetical protein